MIRRVWSDLEHFREVHFMPGMNIVIADRSKDAALTESTNGLGKTTLIRIIQFCMGSDLSRDKVLNHPDLDGVKFGLDFEYRGNEVSVERNTAGDAKTVAVSTEFLDGLSVEVISVAKNLSTITLEDWHASLTIRLLGQRNTSLDDGATGSPTFRELARYYMRLGKAAFSDPKVVYQGQSGPSMRLNVAYLLGLNWGAQKTFHQKSERRTEVTKAIGVLKAAEDNELESLGDLEADRVVLEENISAKTKEVSEFNVRDDYRQLEERLSSVDIALHQMINDNHSDTRLLEHYKVSAKETPDADASRPINILRDAGAIFQESALKSLDQVAEFHNQVFRNRKSFLDDEIKALKLIISSRSGRISDLTEQKTEFLQVLGSSGAIDSLIQLQRSLTDMTVELGGLKTRIEERKKFDRRKDDLSGQMAATRTLLKKDLDDRRDRVDEAVALFARYTRHLYGQPAKLGVDIKTAGYSFNITIDRDGSEGVEQMVVFCFDLVIATLRARRKSPFLTLVHDSTLFADVDPRQYGLALQLAHQESEAEGFQYICCLNAGALPKDQLGELPLETLTRLTLTDDNERTRLLGRRLSAREKS